MMGIFDFRCQDEEKPADARFRLISLPPLPIIAARPHFATAAPMPIFRRLPRPHHGARLV